jgi:hypothetical protein
MKGRIMNDELSLPEITSPPQETIGMPAAPETAPVAAPESAPKNAPNLQLGQIMGLQYGKTDNGIGMTFAVKILQGTIAMFMPAEQVSQLIDAYNITDLNGLMQQKQACAVEVTDEGQVNFVKLV